MTSAAQPLDLLIISVGIGLAIVLIVQRVRGYLFSRCESDDRLAPSEARFRGRR